MHSENIEYSVVSYICTVRVNKVVVHGSQNLKWVRENRMGGKKGQKCDQPILNQAVSTLY